MGISPFGARAALLVRTGVSIATLASLGCGDDSSSDTTKNDAGTELSADAGNVASQGTAQLPPEGAAEVEAWLKEGAYLTWHCEPDVHASRSPSPHGFNRICSNDAVADNASGTADWPKGAAAVKELYASMDGTEPVGYAVYLKKDTDSADGANWYWYERVPSDSAAPHDGAGVVADGLGDTGPAKAICVGCHIAAGADEAHTPSAHGRDQVYTPVM